LSDLSDSKSRICRLGCARLGSHDLAMKITDLAPSSRPRERLLSLGVGQLSDAELLAILIRHGQKNQSALDLAHLWLASCPLPKLFGLSLKEAKKLPGLGVARFCELKAAFELGRRTVQLDLKRGQAITPTTVTELLRFELKHLSHERILLLALDCRLQLLATEVLAIGGVDGVTIKARSVVEAALKHHAQRVILAHNHPSGTREPSRADLAFTDQIRRALLLVDVELVDHFIVADGEPMSINSFMYG
jgi:DNA repair protein RadC